MTIAEHIEDAHVLLGITSATAQQNTRALRAFLQMMRALPGRIGAKWAPVVGTAGYTTTEGERVVCDAPMTVSTPATTQNDFGSTVPTGRSGRKLGS
jgi:hypothetical protein